MTDARYAAPTDHIDLVFRNGTPSLSQQMTIGPSTARLHCELLAN